MSPDSKRLGTKFPVPAAITIHCADITVLTEVVNSQSSPTFLSLSACWFK